MSTKNSSYIVKVTVGGATASKTWNTENELALGHPMRWVLERGEKGVQIRNVADGSTREISDAQLSKSGELDLPESDSKLKSAYKVELKALDLLPAAYESHRDEAGGELRIYSTRGLWTQGEAVVGDSHTVSVEGRRAFTVHREGASGVVVRAHTSGIRVGSKNLTDGQSYTFDVDSLAGNEIEHGEFSWKFKLQKKVAPLALVPAADSDEESFKSILKKSIAFVFVCALISAFLPKPEQEAAPQPTRFVFKKVVKGYMTAAAKGDPSARDHSQGDNKKVAKARGSDRPTAGPKVEKARKGTTVAKAKPAKAQSKAKPKAVAKAKAKAAPSKQVAVKQVAKAVPVPSKAKKIVAQNAPKAAPIAPRGRVLPAPGNTVAKAKPKTNDLANSAIGKLLSSSSLRNATAGAARGGVSRIKVGAGGEAGEMGELARGRNALDETAGVAGGNGVGARRVEVSGTGGGSGFRGGEGVGYGRGSHAAVNGQGKSFVSLDTSASDVAEGLTKDQVGRVIHKHMSEIRYCYEAAMIREPDVEGKLAVNFVIGGNGSVKRAGVAQSSVGDNKLDNCVIERLARWKFPTPRGGVDVAVNYPFVFKTLGR